MRVLIVLTGLISLLAIVGCNGVTKDAAEIRNTAAQSIDLDMRQITDDWNAIWLVDRQYRLTRWNTR